MIELIQFPWSPFCIVQRRILEYSGERFKITNIPNQDRSLVWRLTKQRYYGVPIIRDGKNVVFELNDDSQVIGKYLDQKFNLVCSRPRSKACNPSSGASSKTTSKARRSGSTTFSGRKTCRRRSSFSFCGSRSGNSGAAALSDGARSKMSGWSNWSGCCCRSRKCSSPFLPARRGAALRGFRFVRDAGKFSVFRPLQAARRASAHPGMASADGATEGGGLEMKFVTIFLHKTACYWPPNP